MATIRSLPLNKAANSSNRASGREPIKQTLMEITDEFWAAVELLLPLFQKKIGGSE
jgi:hypothetical protein